MTRRYVSLALLMALVLLAPQGTLAETPSDRWKFSVMPYLWLPSLDADFNYGLPPTGGGSPNVSLDANDLLDNLSFVFMIAGEARKSRYLIGTDIMYLTLAKEDSTVQSVDFNLGPSPINVFTTELNVGTESEVKALLWTQVGGYALLQDEGQVDLDIFGGFRYLGMEAKTDWRLRGEVTGRGPAGMTATFARAGSVEESEDIWAFIIGVKGRIRLGQGGWFANYHGDIGAASSAFTWQALLGFGYAFRWGEIVLDYRYLQYSGDKLIDTLRLAGPALGLRFRF